MKITKEEFDSLPDALKARFQADGDGYSMFEEDVEGLKKSKAAILAEKKALADKLSELEKFKAEFEARNAEAETEQMKKAGQFAELEKKLREALDAQKAQAEAERNQLMATIKRERLLNELTKHGVLADRAKYALADIENEIDLDATENGFALKVKNGIGDAGEFETLVEKMKGQSPFFFAANGATGSGASGSGNGSSVTTGKTMTRTAFEQLDPAARFAFIGEGGKLTD